ncbi:MAG TPA: hypothetical protein VD788_15580 [Candidatus Polarisedimenticolaceae bacterium]|nr:hypothetical protein [Candidatus Polarisedimenticolaceae bacterium]
MITGFNTDIEHLGRVFHVQTEDKGLDNPVVETLVYCGGEIIDARKNSYADLAAAGECSEDEILVRMETQHHALIREIRNGKFDTGGPKPFGFNIISNRSLDEVVLSFLHEQDRLSAISLDLVDRVTLREGQHTRVRLHVVEGATGRSIAGAQVKATLISTQHMPRELASGVSDDSGRVDLDFDLPALGQAELAVLLRAGAAGRRAVRREVVQRSAGSPVGGSQEPAAEGSPVD